MKKKTQKQSRTNKRTDTRTDSMNHSTYYHSFFEGYTEARVPADNKKGYKLVREYTEDWYVMKNDHPSRQKIYYLLLFLAAFISFILSAAPTTSANMTVYVALPVSLSMISLIISGAMLFFYIAAPRKMTIYQHSYSEKLKLSTGFSVITLGICVLCTLLSFILITDSATLTALLCTAGYCIAFICMMMLNRMENHTGYTREYNPNEGPEEGNVIC